MGLGKITTVVQYSVDCCSCSATEVDAAISRAEFIHENRKEGWRFRNKKWMCPSCSKTRSKKEK